MISQLSHSHLTVVEQQPPISQTNQKFQSPQVQLNLKSAQLGPLQSKTANLIVASHPNQFPP